MPLQSYPVAGIIRDNEKIVIPGATVYLVDTTTGEQLGTDFYATTNVNGEYILNMQNLTTYSNGDNYEVFVTAGNYVTGKTTGTVVQAGGGDADKDVDLDPKTTGGSVRDILFQVSKNAYIDPETNEIRKMLDVRLAGVRKTDPITVIDGSVYNDVLTSENSDSTFVKKFNKFALYMDVISAGSPTRLNIQPQFSDNNVDWYDFSESIWPAQITDEQASAPFAEIWIGDCPGEYLRLNVIAEDTGASDTFTVTVKLVLYNAP